MAKVQNFKTPERVAKAAMPSEQVIPMGKPSAMPMKPMMVAKTLPAQASAKAVAATGKTQMTPVPKKQKKGFLGGILKRKPRRYSNGVGVGP